MKVVFLTCYYPPMKGPRPIQIARLVKYSTLPIWVVCGDDEVPKDRSLYLPEPGRPQRLTLIPERRYANWDPRRCWQLLPIPDRYHQWAKRAAAEIIATGELGPDDVLVSFGQPMSDHLAGLRIKQATGVRWIAHFSDPWADSPFRRKLPILDGIHRRQERAVVENADCVVFTSAETVDLVMQRYSAGFRTKMAVLPHAFDPSLYSESPRDDALVLRYVGNFYAPRTPLPLLEALLKICHRRPELVRNLKVELVGRLIGPMHVDGVMAELPPGLVQIVPPVDYVKSLELMSSADLLLVVDAPFEHSVFLPSKLIDYFGARRPILALSPPGAAARLVQELGGLVAHPGDPEASAACLESALECLHQDRYAMTVNKDKVSAYAASAVAARFDRLIQAVARGAMP